MLIFQKNADVWRRGSENLDTCGQGGRGIKNRQKFADVLHGWPLMRALWIIVYKSFLLYHILNKVFYDKILQVALNRVLMLTM